MNEYELKWVTLDDHRLMATHPLGFNIITVHDDDGVPLSCEVCNFLMRDYEDIQAYLVCNACTHCMLFWYEPNREKWDKGWRPSQEEMSFNRKKRSLLPSYIIT